MKTPIPASADELARLLRKRGWTIGRKNRPVIADDPTGGRLVFSSTAVGSRTARNQVSEMLRQERGA